ncbi:unnamed protein product [Rhizophagus irregularis]|nr:unnamed protein product [Rhizophagus irregularis]
MDSHISKVKALYKGHSASETSNKESENGICQECGNLNGFGDDWNFLSEITSHLKLYRSSNTCSEIVRCHGISQNPESKEYIMVLEYCARGDLGKYLAENFDDLTWSKCLDHLLDIARGLNTIHSEGLMHRDIHSGNLLIDICDGFRPEIVEGTPECYKELMQKCWHENPIKRPNIANIVREIEKWLNDILEGDDVWSKADSSRNTIKKLPKIKIHSEAVYKSRLLPTVNNELFVKRSIVTHEVIIKRSRESCNELSCNHSQASCDEFRISNNNY